MEEEEGGLISDKRALGRARVVLEIWSHLLAARLYAALTLGRQLMLEEI